MPITDCPSPLTDDDVRWLMVKTAASLARLWARMKACEVMPGRPPLYQLHAQDMQPPESWLDTVPPRTAWSGIQQAVVLAQGLLLHDATSPQPIDRRRVCLIVQHVSCGATVWSTHTLRLAGKLGVDLKPLVREETYGSSLHNDIRLLDGSAARARAAASGHSLG